MATINRAVAATVMSTGNADQFIQPRAFSRASLSAAARCVYAVRLAITPSLVDGVNAGVEDAVVVLASETSREVKPAGCRSLGKRQLPNKDE